MALAPAGRVRPFYFLSPSEATGRCRTSEARDVVLDLLAGVCPDKHACIERPCIPLAFPMSQF